MNTINTYRSYSTMKKFLEKGDKVFDKPIFDTAIRKYVNYLKSLEIKEETIIRKTGIVYLFLTYLEDNNLSFEFITKSDVYNFLNKLCNLKWSLLYLDRNKFDLKAFFNWAYDKKIVKISGDLLIPKINWHDKSNIKTFYTQEEIKKMLNVIDINTNKGKEHFLIINLICYLGLRISDIINLKLSDINFNDNTISIIQYKTNSKLILPLIDSVKYPLLDYLKNVRPNDSDIDYIFITSNKPYKQKTWLKHKSSIIGKYLVKAGVDIKNRKHGFHSLRFSFSNMLLSKNIPVYTISTILGHQNVKTTMTYLDIDISKFKELALEVPNVK